MKEYARRKSSRLKNDNYSQNGAYFLTICTKDRKMLLGSVGAGVPDGPFPGPETGAGHIFRAICG